MRILWRRMARRWRLEREMHEELAFHLQARADDLMRAGLSRTEAERQARIEFGGMERYKEELRDTRRFGLLEDFGRDLVYACRNLRRSPVFAVCAAAAIALGIGVNAALFSLIYGVLFRPLPVREPQSIRNVYMTTRGEGKRNSYNSRYFVSFAELSHMRAGARTIELAGVSEAGVTAAFASEVLHAQLATDNLLPMLGATPALGRLFTHEEAATPGLAPVAVLSYDAWQRYFHGEDVAGRSIVLNRTPFTIVGVAARDFHGPLILKPDLWIPLTMEGITRAGDPLISDPRTGWIQMIGRVKRQVSDRAVHAELAVLADQAVKAHTPTQRALVTVSAGAFLNYPDVISQGMPVMAILSFVVSLVLLAACANVANMLVARGFSRSREIAIRLSVGAAKNRLIRQLLTEHILLGVLGGIAGLAAAQLAIRSILLALPPLGDHQLDFSPDWRVIGWTMLVALGAGVVFGLPAALTMTRGDLTHSLRGDAIQIWGRRRFGLQSVLITVQVAVSTLLLINAGLLLRAAVTAVHMNPGYTVEHVLIVKPNLRDLQYEQKQAARFFENLSNRILAIPGVSTASLTGFEPVISSCGDMVQPVREDGTPGNSTRGSCHEIGADFFRVMRIPLRQGRAFLPSELAGAAKVAIISDDFARRYYGGQAVGRHIRVDAKDEEIVGVVGATAPLVFSQANAPEVYEPLPETRYLEARLVVAYSGPRAPTVRAIQALAPQLDREVSLDVRSIEQDVAEALSFVRLAAGALSGLGGLALLLACTGVYGVVAFSVGRRRREIGLRLALGARPQAVTRLLLRQSMRPVWIGGAIGTVVAAAGAQMLRSLLYGVSPLDPLGFAGAIGALTFVASLAAFIPAAAALRVDPASTLRHE
jgi:macrolide transport system ATP-binding/permease protein